MKDPSLTGFSGSIFISSPSLLNHLTSMVTPFQQGAFNEIPLPRNRILLFLGKSLKEIEI
jgi:hypothetical protein